MQGKNLRLGHKKRLYSNPSGRSC